MVYISTAMIFLYGKQLFLLPVCKINFCPHFTFKIALYYVKICAEFCCCKPLYLIIITMTVTESFILNVI